MLVFRCVFWQEKSKPLNNLRSESSGGKMVIDLWDGHKVGSSTGWCFEIFFIFTPKIGEDSHFDEHMFQIGSNHQHSSIIYKNYHHNSPIS